MDNADFRDLPKKYSNTYFQYRPINSKKPWHTCYAEDFRIWYAESDEQVNYFMIKTRDGWIKSLDYEFNFDFPPIGILNYRDTVVIANKYPARQWKKAATPENFIVYLPTRDILYALKEEYTLPKKMTWEFKWGVDNVEELFNNKFLSYKEACISLKLGERFACAITPEFFVTNSHYNSSILLWRYNTIIAEIYSDRVSYIEPMFKQEALDFFERNI